MFEVRLLVEGAFYFQYKVFRDFGERGDAGDGEVGGAQEVFNEGPFAFFKSSLLPYYIKRITLD